MKKLIALILALLCVLSLAACAGGGSTQGDDADDEGSKSESKKEPSEYDKAVALLDEGKIEEAYYALTVLSDKGNAKAANKLKDFHVVTKRKNSIFPDGSFSEILCSYDEKGNIVEKIHTENNSIYSKTTFENTYDKKGRLIKIVFNYNNNSPSKVYEFKYNDRDLVTELIRPDFSVEYIYDSKGVLVNEIITNNNRRHQTNREYTYNSNGDVTLAVSTYLYKNEEKNDTSQFTYDNNNRLIKYEEYIRGVHYITQEFSYNENNFLNKAIATTSKNTSVTEKEYDGKGNVAKITYSNTGEELIFTNTYDEKGRLTKQLISQNKNQSNNWHEYEYKYDSYGNIVKRVHKSSYSEATETEEYKIFYRPNNFYNDKPTILPYNNNSPTLYSIPYHKENPS